MEEEETTETEQLVTLPEMAERYNLSPWEVNQVRKAIWHHARMRPGQAYLYPESVVLSAIQRRWPRSAIAGTPLGVGKFPPATDLEWCPCGRSWVSRTALLRHVERDHHWQLPPQVDEIPNLTAYWNELATDVMTQKSKQNRRSAVSASPVRFRKV